MNKTLNEYDTVKNILIKHDVLNKDIEDLDDTKLMLDLYDAFSRRYAIWNTESKNR
jgi:hypothetical protein